MGTPRGLPGRTAIGHAIGVLTDILARPVELVQKIGAGDVGVACHLSLIVGVGHQGEAGVGPAVGLLLPPGPTRHHVGHLDSCSCKMLFTVSSHSYSACQVASRTTENHFGLHSRAASASDFLA